MSATHRGPAALLKLDVLAEMRALARAKENVAHSGVGFFYCRQSARNLFVKLARSDIKSSKSDIIK